MIGDVHNIYRQCLTSLVTDIRLTLQLCRSVAKAQALVHVENVQVSSALEQTFHRH